MSPRINTPAGSVPGSECHWGCYRSADRGAMGGIWLSGSNVLNSKRTSVDVFLSFLSDLPLSSRDETDPVPCIPCIGALPSLLISLVRRSVPPLPGLPTPSPRPATEGSARFLGGSDPAATSITSSPLGNYQACEQKTPAFGFFWEERHRGLRLCSPCFCIFYACLLLLDSLMCAALM